MGILQDIIRYQIQKRKEQEQNLASYAGQEGWGEAEKQFGTKKMLDLYQGLFGKGMMPPQRTIHEVSGDPGPSYEFEGMEAQGIKPPSYTTSQRTERIWPQPSSEQMVERGTKEQLGQPGVLQGFIRSKLEGGTPWERIQAKLQQSKDKMMAIKSLITSGISVVTPEGNRPITSPEAKLWVDELLERREPPFDISPPATEVNKLQLQLALSPFLDPLYGQDYATLSQGDKLIANKAFALGLAQIYEGKFQPAQFKAEPQGPPETRTTPDPLDPNNKELVQTYDKTGKLLSSVSRTRFKDESSTARSFTQKQYEDQIDGELSKIFLDEAEANYKKMLQSKNIPVDKMDTLRDLMLVMGGKDPMNAQRIYADTIYKYLPPEQKKRFDRIREQASKKWTSGQVQYVPSIMREILETEETLKAPSAKPPTMKDFIEGARQKPSETGKPLPKTYFIPKGDKDKIIKLIKQTRLSGSSAADVRKILTDMGFETAEFEEYLK